jgi:hypothetical protein
MKSIEVIPAQLHCEMHIPFSPKHDIFVTGTRTEINCSVFSESSLQMWLSGKWPAMCDVHDCRFMSRLDCSSVNFMQLTLYSVLSSCDFALLTVSHQAVLMISL